MIAGCGNSNPSSFGFVGSANASIPQFLQVGRTYDIDGMKVTIIEIDKETGWVKAVRPDRNDEWRWINLAQIKTIGEA